MNAVPIGFGLNGGGFELKSEWNFGRFSAKIDALGLSD
jgi:hypothetical protein